MKKLIFGLLWSFCTLISYHGYTQQQAFSKSDGNIPHSVWVVRFADEAALASAVLPLNSSVVSAHHPMHILVVKNDDLGDVSFLDQLQNTEGIVRIETAYYDNSGSPLYPTGVVILQPGDNKNAARDFCDNIGCTKDREMGHLGWFAALLPPDLSFEEFQIQAQESGYFNQIMRDEIILAHTTVTNDPYYTNCWYIYQANDKDIDAEEAWNAMPAGTTAKNVAVIDGHGFDTTHPDMVNNWADTYNAVDQTGNVLPENEFDRHGTSCAGIPGAEYNNSIGTPGLGKNLLLVQAIKIGYNIQSGGTFYTSSLIEADAINRAISNNNTVTISMSFGSTSYQSAFFNAISAARTTGRNGKGIIVFASTGNDGVSTWTNYPASYSGVIAVGSTTSSDARSSFSNYGAGVSISAPGTGITTIDIVGATGYSANDYTNFSGTSAACPVAASVGAMMLAANPTLTEVQGKLIMAQSCDKVGGYVYNTNATQNLATWSNEIGYGRVNMYNAVQQALAIVSVTPDINISASAVDDNTATIGQVLNISCNQVTTNPTGPLASVTLEYRWSTDDIWSASDVLIGTDISSLGNGVGSEAESISYTVPLLTSGTRYILIKCDATGVITESNETNNVVAIPVTIALIAVLPDITLSNYSTSNNSPTVGQSITINSQQVIVNAALSSSNVVLEYRYSTDNIWSASDILIGYDTSAIGLLVTINAESINYIIPSGAGSRYVLIKTDATSVISESDENNNIYALPLTVSNPVLIPDVTISSLTASSTTINEGQTITVNCQQAISNGPAMAVAAIVEYRWSVDPVWSTTNDLLLGNNTSLLGNGVAAEAETLIFSVPVGTGTRYLLVKADATNLVSESNESNTYIMVFAVASVAPILPDISLAGLTANNTNVIIGESIIVTSQQTITGTGTAVQNAVMEYRWSTDQIWSSSSDILLGADTSLLNSVATTETETLTFTIPTGTGVRYLIVKVDAPDAISESNEVNTFILAFNVSAPPLPDITINALATANTNVVAGQIITVSCNQLIANPPSTSIVSGIEFRWSADLVWSTTTDALVGTASSTLGIGTLTEAESLVFTVPSGNGTKYLLVKADVNNIVAESNESNIYNLTFTVSTAVPDITLANITVAGTSVVIGQSVGVNCSQLIVNGPTSPITSLIEYRWSTDQIWSPATDPLVGSASSSLSNVLASEAEVVSFVVPNEVGTRYLIIRADAANAVVESNEANEYIIAFTVTNSSSLPDIYLDQVVSSLSAATAGQMILVSSFQNISIPSVAGVNVFMEYRWATTPTWANTYPIIGVDYSSLGLGDEDDDESLLFAVPAGIGQRYILIKCDSNNGVNESNENNNIVAIPVMVNAPAVVSSLANNSADINTDDTIVSGANEWSEDVELIDLELENQLENQIATFQAYPNPTRGKLKISFPTPTASRVNFDLINMIGEVVLSDFIPTESQTIEVGLEQLKNGIYFLRMNIENSAIVQRIVLAN